MDSHPLDLLLGPALDGGTPWRHALDDGRARAGWQACGPWGLVRRLGKLLGRPVPDSAEPIRAAVWAARLARHDDGARSYSASRRHDAFGVARQLVRWRDELVLAGWDGRKLDGSRRLADLAEIDALAPEAPPGLPDVVRRVIADLRERPLPVPVRIAVTSPREHLPALLRSLLDALAERGATVEAAAPDRPAAPASSDLGRLQRALLGEPSLPLSGDGTVVILEGETPWQAADLAAAWQADRPGGRTLVVPAEAAILGAALEGAGQPPLGLSDSSRWRPALQVLPLRLALAFRPRDPQTALELLTLPIAPLTWWIRRKLVEALLQMPGLDGPDWQAAVAACAEEAAKRTRDEGTAAGAPARLVEQEAAAAAEDVRERIDRWFGGSSYDPREGIPAGEAARLCEAVAAWAQGRGRLVDPPDPLLVHAAMVASSLRRMLLAFPEDARIPRVQLEQLHDSAVGRGSDWGASPGGAGRPALCSEPAAVVGPVDEVVWWGFVGEAAPLHAPTAWTGAERRSLAAAGVALPPAGATRAQEAWGWRRPAMAATRRLVLVRWRLSGREPSTAHPFADELAARLGATAIEACTVAAERVLGEEPVRFSTGAAWSPERAARTPNPPVRPRALWKVPSDALVPRTPLSATQIEALFTCPLRWTLSYVARLRSAAIARLPDGDRLVGLFGHRIVQDVLMDWDAAHPGEPMPPELAAREACDRFDARVEGEAAPWLRPGREVDHDQARRTIADAASALCRLLGAGGWTAESKELQVAGQFAGLPFAGSVDLVVRRADGRRAIVDLKLGRGRYKRDEMAEGRALQLALYARGLSAASEITAEAPPTAFYVMNERRLLTTSEAFPGATRVRGPSDGETVERAERAWRSWTSALTRGVVPARHRDFHDWQESFHRETGEWPPAGPDAPCRFCDFAAVCTVRIEADAAPAGGAR